MLDKTIFGGSWESVVSVNPSFNPLMPYTTLIPKVLDKVIPLTGCSTLSK